MSVLLIMVNVLQRCVHMLVLNHRYHGYILGCVSHVSVGILKITGVIPSITYIGKRTLTLYIPSLCVY